MASHFGIAEAIKSMAGRMDQSREKSELDVPSLSVARCTVCVVDDDFSLRRALRRLIAAAGFSVDTFESAEAFLSAHGADVGCLVLDVSLGSLSAFEVYDRLVASGRRVPVIFITGHDTPSNQERARAAGALAYLVKPFDEAPLLDAIRRAMERSVSVLRQRHGGLSRAS